MTGKIAILIDRLNVGGVEKIAIEEVRALRSLGEDAYLVVLRRKGITDNAFADLRVNIPTIYLDDRLPDLLKLSFKFPIFSFFSLFHISYPFLIPFVLKRNEFDYIITHGTYTAFTAIALKKIKKIRYSVFIWDPIGYILIRAYSEKLSIFMNLFTGLAKSLDKLIVKNADFVLTGGDAHNKYIKTLHNKVKIKTIPPSVYPLKKLKLRKENFVLLVTAWKKGKNPEYIFEIIKKIPNIKIKMVGKWIDNIYKNEFLKEVELKGYNKNIEVVGEVTEKNLSNYYENAFALLQINDDRGFGMPALEAAGHGTTFIIPKGQGVCALFQHKVHGFYTREKDTKAILSYMSLLIQDKKKSARMGRHAWENVKNKYSWEQHARQLKAIN